MKRAVDVGSPCYTSHGVRPHRSPRGPRGPRLHARPRRAVLHASPRRPGRARRQGRARPAAATTCARATSSSSRTATTRAPTSRGSMSARKAWASTSGARRRARSSATSRGRPTSRWRTSLPGSPRASASTTRRSPPSSPDLVYCSISGFGQTGPWRERPAFAHIINAASGLMHLEQGDAPAPRSANLQAADVLCGHARLRRHPGRAVAPRADGSGRADRRLDARGPDRGRRRVLRGRCSTAARRSARRARAWASTRSAGAIWRSRPWARRSSGRACSDDGPARAGQRPALRDGTGAPRALAPAARPHRPVARALPDGGRGGGRARGPRAFPAAPVLEPREVIAHPHLSSARRAFPRSPTPRAAACGSRRARITGTASPVHPAGPAPYRVGEHSRLVLSGLLGYDAARIDTLIASGAVEAP